MNKNWEQMLLDSERQLRELRPSDTPDRILAELLKHTEQHNAELAELKTQTADNACSSRKSQTTAWIAIGIAVASLVFSVFTFLFR